MKNYLALLRGINVSGQKIIKMEDLRRYMEEAGYKGVRTYIQSGNIIFGTESKEDEIAADIQQLILDRYGFGVTVIVLDAKSLRLAIETNPFAEGPHPEPAGVKKLYVAFLDQQPASANFEKLQRGPIGNDIVALYGKALYMKLDTSAADTKLTNTFIESRLRVKATTRNWNTTLKLMELLGGC